MQPFLCPVCHGRGTVPANFYSGLNSGTSADRDKCRSCFGTGIVWGTQDQQPWPSEVKVTAQTTIWPGSYQTTINWPLVTMVEQGWRDLEAERYKPATEIKAALEA